MGPVLSVIIPVFNEERLLGELLRRVSAVDYGVETEFVVVDDGSTDGTRGILEAYRSDGRFKIVEYPRNRGKGFAIRQGLGKASGDVVVFQDADLEYNPQDLPKLVRPILEGRESVVYGSRFCVDRVDWLRLPHPHHYVGNRFISLAFNLMYSVKISDVETGYKAVARKVLDGMELESDGFSIEVELTVKILRKGYRIHEEGVEFHPRGFSEGKKITWVDGVKALIKIVKYRLT